MCKHGDTVLVEVPIPGDLSHTGEDRWDTKQIDRCIAELVDAFNKGGRFTIGSCCGHGKQEGSILFWDGGELTFPTVETG